MATIQIADDDARVQYTQAVVANTTQLTIDFPFFDLDDLNVIVTDAAGTDTTLSRGTGTGTFTVVGVSVDDGFSGGYVTLGDSYSAGTDTFTIFRDIPVQRTTDFPTSGPFNISSLNTELDKIIAIEQELETKITRTLQLSDSDTTIDLKLPNLDIRKGTTLAFNATTGQPEAGPTISGVTTVAALAADIATLADIEDGTVATDAISDAAAIASDITTVSGISSNVSAVVANASNINAVNANSSNINTVAGINANVTTVAGISSSVTTAAGISADITAVAADATDIGTVSANISNVNTVAGISADVSTVAADGTDIGVVAGIASDVTTVSGISANVTSVAGNSSNINAVAGNATNINAVAADAADIGTVSSNIANVNTVASNTSNINAVVADATDIGTVATNIANVNTTANNIANVNSVAGNSVNINAVAADATDIGTVSTNIANVNTVAGIDANVTTVAGIASDVTAAATNVSDIQAISAAIADVITVADDLNEATSEIDTVANNITNVNLVGASITDVNTVASNLSGITAFADVYASGPTDPTTNLNEGDLFFNTTTDTLKVYTGTAWEAGVTAGSGFLPLIGGQLTGNLTFSSTQTVDGRDLSVDGAKLDGIEAGATADQTASEILTEIKTVDGSGSGLDADLLDGQQGSYYLDANNFTNMPPSDVVGDTTPQLGGNLDTNGNDITFGDNDKAIFGAGSDLQIYHNGTSASYITDQGTGNLVLGGDSAIILQNSAHNANMLDAYNGGRVGLYHANSLKLVTTATGIDVTGVITTDGLTTSADINFGDNDKANFGAGSDLQIYHDGANSFIAGNNAANNTVVVKPGGTGTVLITNSAGDNIITQQGDAAHLHYDNFTKLATTSTGVDVTGVITTDGMTTSANVNFGDSDKAVFGAGSDLEIYHDGADNLIRDLGTGDNYIQTNNSWRFTDVGNNETHMIINDNGAIHLYYDNATKLSTTSAGVSVTGTVAATSFTGDGSALTGISGGTAEGSAKAWADLDGTGTPAFDNSYNFSSVTDNGVGNYTLSFTSTQPNANYAPSGVSGETSGTEMWEISSRSTSSYSIDNYKADTGASVDSVLMAHVIHGD